MSFGRLGAMGTGFGRMGALSSGVSAGVVGPGAGVDNIDLWGDEGSVDDEANDLLLWGDESGVMLNWGDGD